MIADPYTKAMVARDWVNQGAAVLLTSEVVAREVGIASDRWVYLHGYADVTERAIPEREDLGASPAMKLAYEGALAAARLTLDRIDCFDLYSCFPIAVFAACDALNLSPADPRPLTVTGGLPFFGGPGNNYSMHAIASMVERLRADPGSFGMVGANGGYLSKHSVGVYSTRRVENWQPCDSSKLQQQIDALPAPPFTEQPDGTARIETYTVLHGREGAEAASIFGRMESNGARFVAMPDKSDPANLQSMSNGDPLGRRIVVRTTERGNLFSFADA
jgi:acetyl-CoA C-acetyltransferase